MKPTPFASSSKSGTCPKGYARVGGNCVKIPGAATPNAMAPSQDDVAKYLAQTRLKAIGKQVGAAFTPGRPSPRKGVK